MNEESTKVTCQICNKEFNVITPAHLQKSHQISMKEYRNQFPNSKLVSKETRARTAYSLSQLFKNNQQTNEIKDLSPQEERIFEEISTDRVPIIQEIEDITPIKKVEKKKDIKENLLDIIHRYLPFAKRDFLIRFQEKDGRLRYEYISDIADPKNKIFFDFPEMFMHNKDKYIDPSRDVQLKDDGWIIISVLGASPSTKTLEEELKKIKL